MTVGSVQDWAHPEAARHRASQARPDRWRRRLRGVLAESGSFGRLAILTSLVGLLFWGLVPAVVGWRTTIITSNSMAPKIWQGDLVAVAPIDAATAETAKLDGMVVQVEKPTRPGELLMHRVVRRDPDGRLITKGDANASADSAPVSPSAVRGVGRLRVPVAGLPMLWSRTGQRVPLVALGLALVVLVWPVRRRATPG